MFGYTRNPIHTDTDNEYQDSQFDSFFEQSTKHINLHNIDDCTTPPVNPWTKVTRNKILKDESTIKVNQQLKRSKQNQNNEPCNIILIIFMKPSVI
jgi:hypothetical protein